MSFAVTFHHHNISSLYISNIYISGSAFAASASNEITDAGAEESRVTLPRSYEDTEETAESLSGSVDDTVTLMIYMVGSNLESDAGAATADMTEIMASGVDTSRCNVPLDAGTGIPGQFDQYRQLRV